MALSVKELTNDICEVLDQGPARDDVNEELALILAWSRLCGRLDIHAERDRNARRIVEAIERRIPHLRNVAPTQTEREVPA